MLYEVITADIQTYRDVDVVLTTRECGRLLKRLGIHLPDMEPGTADPLIGQYTGAATIFGRTGGVMEAAIRTAYELLTGTSLEKLVITSYSIHYTKLYEALF